MTYFLETKISDTFKYKKIKKTENAYEMGINSGYPAYTPNRESSIVFSQNILISYQGIEKYLKKVAQKFPQIQIEEKILSGMPVIKNTRIPVTLIIACLKDEMSFREICDEYGLTEEDIEKAMEYVIEVLDIPYQEG